MPCRNFNERINNNADLTTIDRRARSNPRVYMNRGVMNKKKSKLSD